ncbi:MAG: hypothetical protein AAF293_09020, partial [Pseudomonadota bacterium]
MGTPQHRETEIADQADHVVALGIDNLATLEELFGERLGAEIVSTMEDMIRPLLPDGSDLVVTSRA